jgi:hypothetical protein
MIKRRVARIKLGYADVALLPGSQLDDAIRRGVTKAAGHFKAIVSFILLPDF